MFETISYNGTKEENYQLLLNNLQAYWKMKKMSPLICPMQVPY